MKKEVTLCDSCGSQREEADYFGAGPGIPLVGEGENARAFSFDLTFHPMAHGSAPRAGVSRAGPAPDLCYACVNRIVESGLKERASKQSKEADAKDAAA